MVGAGVFLRFTTAVRSMRMSWLIVGIVSSKVSLPAQDGQAAHECRRAATHTMHGRACQVLTPQLYGRKAGRRRIVDEVPQPQGRASPLFMDAAAGAGGMTAKSPQAQGLRRSPVRGRCPAPLRGPGILRGGTSAGVLPAGGVCRRRVTAFSLPHTRPRPVPADGCCGRPASGHRAGSLPGACRRRRGSPPCRPGSCPGDRP